MARSSADASLVRFSCWSTLSDRLTAAETLDIVRRAWSYNSRNGITGELRVAGGRCEQTIEGPCDVILPLAARVLSDPRHGEIRVEAFGAVAQRCFPDWRCLEIDTAPAAHPEALDPGAAGAFTALRPRLSGEAAQPDCDEERRGASL